MQAEPCFCCGTQVETVILEIDGSLHSCPRADLSRFMAGHRRVVDEGWWERLQAPAEEVPAPSATVTNSTATPRSGWVSL